MSRFARLLVAFSLPAIFACGLPGILGPDAPQGVELLSLKGPHCPVLPVSGACPAEPFQAWVRIADEHGRLLARVQTEPSGRYRAGLPPGRYLIRGEALHAPLRAEEVHVEVEQDVWTPVVVRFDTGIR